MALKKKQITQKAKNDNDKTRVTESKELINALDKIKNIAG